jgi:hypothetical protein
MFSLMTPTRGRPKQLRDMAESARATARKPIEIVVRLDDDDPDLPEILKVTKDCEIAVVIGTRNIIHSARWDTCLPLCTGELLFHVNDDVIFRTEGWDEMVEAEFEKYPDKILMVHGNDWGFENSAPGVGREKFGCHPIVHRRWVEILGYFAPPYFDGDGPDTWINDLANRINRRVYLPFIVEHMHYIFGRAEPDANMNERLARQQQQQPMKIFEEKLPERIAEAAKLAAYLGTPYP